MRHESTRAFRSSNPAAVGRGPFDNAAERAARDMVFLRTFGVAPDILAAAATRAAKENVCPSRGLLAYEAVSESLFYRALADHLGLGFEAGWPQLAAPVDVRRSLDTGRTKLAEQGGWLIAPTDEALRILLAARGHLAGAPFGMRLTTPAHLAAVVRHRAGAAIVHAASRSLPDSMPRRSAMSAFDARAKSIFGAALLLGVVSTVLAPAIMLDGIGATFFAGMVFRLIVCAFGIGRDRVLPITLDEKDAPFYSVLVPLYREAGMVPSLVDALGSLDYPLSKLEILILVETDDIATREALARINLAPAFRVIVVPDGMPRTKPRALNVGLLMARGDLITVYDAEDRPDPDQLRRAADRFSRASDTLACLQARLAIRNGEDGWLARLFAIEYASLFDLFNVGLGRLRLPMALGGTSNHFRCDALREIGGWDAWNVTEDADIGLRLARFGYGVDVLASTTWEDALVAPAAWFLQRRRWAKGWMQTTIVLLRDWRAAWRELGAYRAMAVTALLINLVAGPLLTPPFATLVTANVIRTGLPTPHGIVEVAEATIACSVLVAGVVSTLWLGYAGSRAAGRKGDVPILPLLLPYQLMISMAAWGALYDLFRAPFHWHKTEHRPNAAERQPRSAKDTAAMAQASVRSDARPSCS